MSKPLTREAAESRFKQLKPEPILYTFHLKLSKEGYEGIAESNFQVADASKDLFFDYSGKEVVQLIINKKKVDNIDYDKSFLKLPKESLQEGPNTVIVQFKTKYDNDGQGCVSFVDVDKKQYVYSQFEPYAANRVWPIFDQPDLKGKMVLNITAPKEWKVLSNERPTHRGPWNAEEFAKGVKSSDPELVNKFMGDSEGQMVLHPETKVLPNYLFCFVAGEYSELECPNPYKGMPMSLYCIDSLLEHLKRMAPFIWEVTIEAMKFYESFFGYPFSFNKYEQIFAHEYKWGAMENAGIVTFNDDYVFKEKVSDEKMFDVADTITHELAHHWFGNLVTMKWWDDLWLNESFADFISYFCLEKIRDKITTLKYDSSFASFHTRKGWGYAEDQMVTTHPIRGPVPNTAVAESIFDGITYSKGASTMKQLMFVMKEENFSKALSEYFHKYEWKNTVLDNFIDCMQHHFKNEHFTLDDWKKAWLETACLNQIEPVWDVNNHEKDAKLVIKQSPVLAQHPTLRMHNIRVAFFKDNCEVDQVETWVLPKEESTLTYDGTKNYKAVLLNYEDWSFVKHVLDKQSIQFFEKNLCKVPDILSRALIWKSFFDMVKDSKLTSCQYMKIVVNNIAQESYDSVFEKQFDLLRSAITAYTPKQYRDAMTDNLFYFVLWLLKTTPKDKVNRLVVLKNKLIDFAATKETKKIVVQWWADKFEPLKDQPMTVGQQWNAVIKAHTLKYYSEEQKHEIFARQAKLDTSDTQKGKKLTCEAITATKEQFAKLYESYKDPNNDMPTSQKRASMQGFNNPVHLDWIESEYLQKFFEDLPAVCEKLDADASIGFMDNLQPCSDDLGRLIKGYSELIPRLEKFERAATEAKMNLDVLQRRQKAYEFFEKQQAAK